MEELKQRLSRTSISSDMDIDRIVKESKTTTITEARETIYFRHRGEDSKKTSTPCGLEIPTLKRLSILDTETDERRTRKKDATESIGSSQENAVQHQKPDDAQPIAVVPKPTETPLNPPAKESEGVDDLMSDYHSLEMELKDINEKNKELRKKFFDDKKETPTLTCSTSTAAPVSTRIQEWKTTSIRSSEAGSKEKKKCSFASGSIELKPESGGAVVRLPPPNGATSKRNGCSFNFIK